MLVNLKKLRNSKNLSQAKLAEIVNCQQQTIAKYERGECEASLELAIKLADALDTSLDYLVGKTDDPCKHSLYEPDSHSENDVKLFEDFCKLSEKQKEFVKLTIEHIKN